MVLKRDHNARIARQILDKKAMARGVVVLDEDLFGLEPALRDANILVVKPPMGWRDQDNKESLLYHRIIVTINPSVFVDDAPVYEYGVIALDKLKFIDLSPTYQQNPTVRLLSKAMSKYRLWAKGAKFLLELREDGKHVLTELS